MLAWINLWHFPISCPHFHYCSGKLFLLCTGNKTTSIISRALFIHTIAQLQQTSQWCPCQVLCFLQFCNSALCLSQQRALQSSSTTDALTLNPDWKHTAKHPLPLAARLWMTNKGHHLCHLVKIRSFLILPWRWCRREHSSQTNKLLPTTLTSGTAAEHKEQPLLIITKIP